MKYSIFKTTGPWKHFTRAEDGQSAKCILCPNGKIIKCTGGSTKGLHTHLSAAHPTVSRQTSVQSDSAPALKKPKLQQQLLSFSSGEISMQARLARLTAVSNIPFRVLAESEDIRDLFNHRYGINALPRSTATISKIVTNYATSVTAQIIENLRKRKAMNAKFSLSFDEWTSVRGRRYMNINVHDYDQQHGRTFYNLGLIRIDGPLNHTACLKLVCDRLALYGLDLETDIIAFCTDGAALMVRVGKDAKVLHQLCYSHAIHLAVCDVLYKNPFCEEVAGGTTHIDCTDEEFDTDDETSTTLVADFQPAIGDCIKKVRKIVTFFHRSSVANDKLQFFIQAGNGHELELIIDCRTRWNSLLAMLERYTKLHSFVRQALIALSKEPLALTDQECNVMKNVCSALLPVKTAVDGLNRRDCDLVVANRVIDFVIMKLKKATEESSFASNLCQRLTARMAERTKIMTEVLLFLESGDLQRLTVQQVTDFIFSLVNNSKFGVEMISAASSSAQDSVVTELEPKTESTLEEELQQFLDSKASHPRNEASSLESIVQMEVDRLLATKVRGKLLTIVAGWLHSIPPTSVECERAFSVAGTFASKIRNRISDRALNDMCILKWFFKQTCMHL